ncbi:hypothetical protein HDU67_006311 [Dinochytrium kinnereticum]|nr:hypothetical protein HDU67_006311 [Dinochytrium kinnereticum]
MMDEVSADDEVMDCVFGDEGVERVVESDCMDWAVRRVVCFGVDGSDCQPAHPRHANHAATSKALLNSHLTRLSHHCPFIKRIRAFSLTGDPRERILTVLEGYAKGVSRDAVVMVDSHNALGLKMDGTGRRPGDVDGIWGEEEEKDGKEGGVGLAVGVDSFLGDGKGESVSGGVPGREIVVVVGKRGLGAVRRAVMGSLSEYLVRHAPRGCAVILPSRAS